MRLIVAALLASCGLAFVTPAPAGAQPLNCPPNCDRIPASAWIAPTSIPLYADYRWPELGGLAVTAADVRFRFEEVCATAPVAVDPRSWSVAARSSATSRDGQWQLRAQVMHWRGDTWQAGQTAVEVFDSAVAALRSCQLTAPLLSPSITTAQPNRVAAVLSGPDRSTLHQYLLVDPHNSTVTELALWSAPLPRVAWPAVSDSAVLDALAAPLCAAYLDSCR